MDSGKLVIANLGEGTVKIGAYGAAEGDCVDVGYTKDGIEITVEREYADLMADQALGLLNKVKTSEAIKVKIRIAEIDVDNLAIAMDMPSTAVVAGVFDFGGDSTSTNKAMFINVTYPDGRTQKIELYKVRAISGGSHTYKKDDQTLYEIEFQALQDTTKTANQQIGQITETGADTTAPTIAITTPAEAGTVTKETAGTVVFTITEANLMDENTIVYGDTIQIVNTTGGSEGLVAGTIVYDASAKTITFTPASNWTASNTLVAIASTGLKDSSGNALATTYVAEFSVTA
ncbi:Ig-like domain-containing protein [Patescibacteria group bacterium]|nr:Ig-like domain-containing protein [Patescibacteria group bacterium]